MENYVKSEQTVNTGGNPNILIRSENCTAFVEERKKASDKSANSILTTAGVFGIIVMFSPAIFAFLEDKKLSQVDSVPLPVLFIMVGILIAVWVRVTKTGKKFNEVYNQYKQYCSTEVLIIEDTKIYGSTSKGSISLTYNQIESVEFSPNVYSPEKKTPIIPNDIFTVRDIVGNEFTFYSFKNCKDLKVVIDTKIKGN